jgi:hypothetical protein
VVPGGPVPHLVIGQARLPLGPLETFLGTFSKVASSMECPWTIPVGTCAIVGMIL